MFFGSWVVPSAIAMAKLSVTCAILVERTGAPWQGVLEGVEEVPQHPGHDGVVEDADQEGHEHGGNPFTFTNTNLYVSKTKKV